VIPWKLVALAREYCRWIITCHCSLANASGFLKPHSPSPLKKSSLSYLTRHCTSDNMHALLQREHRASGEIRLAF
jgi:hypothetical protein